MVKLEEISTKPSFSNQLENKMLYSNHSNDISISYTSTYTLKYVIEGIKHYNYNNENIEVSKNQYLILNNSKITTEAKKGTKGLSFFLSSELLNEILNYHTTSTTSFEFIEATQKQSNNKVRLFLEQITYLYENDRMTLQQQIEDLFIKLSELIVQEQNAIDNKFTRLKIVKHDTKRDLYRSILKAEEYLQDNLARDISLEILSKDIGISKYYLHRLFTEIHGDTPLKYLTGIRLQKAKNKLRYSTASIFETAIACGFDNTSYFSNIFKAHTGVSPSQFRKAF
ncbi:helix-turn-helix domain-containing protein [Aquimarina algicola]|uniref:Helix-turn-helix domain-containing protein n=1 Tax=Aquimarina algicola TaxID=2589995 RepID=A0A504J4P3_9FLAO|nr:helix-turn-helix domain-containing protein [Aquimarina algicola]TPN83472.1 helix-turn-helix domain-containing protein [Aquimarina algicola]